MNTHTLFPSEDVATLRIIGKILRSDESDLELRDRAIRYADRNLILDLADVRSIDDAGVGTIVGLHVSFARRGFGLHILKPPEGFLEVLHATNLIFFVRVYYDEEEAKRGFGLAA